jgi:NADP-dependent 3-hydroxy acid dehydrogenase YdfG
MDRVIVITGASTGIGAAFAVLASEAGAKVVLAARRTAELEAVRSRLGGEAITVTADVTKRSDVEHLRDEALKRFGHVDVWVNNAGRGITRSVQELTDDELDAMLQLNLKSVLYGMQAVLPHFKSRNAGHIINVSSALSRVPFAPGRAAYAAAKAAMNMLTANLRMELANSHPGIKVSAILYGVVATEFGVNALNGGMDSRRFPGAQSPEDAARVLLDAIENPRPEIYGTGEAPEMAKRYLADVAGVEAEIAARFRR